MIEVGEYIVKLATMMIENHKASNDMEACMTKLGTMGWDESDAKYQTALLLFGESADIRKDSIVASIGGSTTEMMIHSTSSHLETKALIPTDSVSEAIKCLKNN
ncbi:hypothetical protein R6Q59_006641 [Mikania micrantha]